MKTKDILVKIPQSKKNFAKALSLLDQSVRILSSIEVTSPRYQKDIKEILDGFDELYKEGSDK